MSRSTLSPIARKLKFSEKMLMFLAIVPFFSSFSNSHLKQKFKNFTKLLTIDLQCDKKKKTLKNQRTNKNSKRTKNNLGDKKNIYRRRV